MTYKMNRKEFLSSTTALLSAAAGLTALSACGSDDDDDETNGTGGSAGSAGSGGTSTGGTAGSGGSAGTAGSGGSAGTAGSGGSAGTAGSGGNGGGGVSMCNSDVALVNMHTHAVTVPPADVEAGAAMTYTLSDVGGHTHTIMVSAADMATLAGGGSVTITSSADGLPSHSHGVTVMCS